jgi:hypothetical protein
MIRGRVLAALVALAAVVAIAGCGGGDDPEVATPGPKAAEDAARDFLVAGVNGDVDRACGLLSDDLTAELDQSITCETLVEVQADLAKEGEAEFDSVKIDASNAEEIELQTFVSDDGQSANVTGPAGEQNIALEVLNGDWLITGLPAYEESS